jgi:CelD/BcsL family acetyltransferase involved in cellulose biosynthesis
LTLRVEVVHSLITLETLAPAWAELDLHTFPRTPFSGPLWNLIWWRHFAKRRWLVRDLVHAFVMFDGSRLIAIAPMMVSERPAVGPLRTRQLRCFGADNNVTELRGPCFRREDEGRVFDAMLSWLRCRALEWDWIDLCGFEVNGPADKALANCGLGDLRQQASHCLIEPGTDWEAYRTSLPRNLKESLRKCYASLRRDNLSHELKVAEQPAAVACAVDRFLQLHSARAAAPMTPKHADKFDTEPSRAFIREYMGRAAGSGEAKVFELLVEGEVVASRIGFVLNDNLYLYFSGYQPKMSKYSVMTTCLVETIRWAIGKKIKTINLSPGSDQSKRRWRPVEVPLCEARLVPWSPREMLHWV